MELQEKLTALKNENLTKFPEEVKTKINNN